MRPGRPPTARQIYALAAAFCARDGYEWPADRVEASELLGELRREIGHARADHADNPLHPRAPRWRRHAEWELHREIADVYPRAQHSD